MDRYEYKHENYWLNSLSQPEYKRKDGWEVIGNNCSGYFFRREHRGEQHAKIRT